MRICVFAICRGIVAIARTRPFFAANMKRGTASTIRMAKSGNSATRTTAKTRATPMAKARATPMAKTRAIPMAKIRATPMAKTRATGCCCQDEGKE